jgi:hypothetical protein
MSFINKMVVLGMVIVTLLNGYLGCANGKKPSQEKSMTIQEVINKHTPELMAIPEVVGTALGKKKGKFCIMVLVTKKTPEVTKQIPHTLDGFPVMIQETGEIRALDKE